MWSVSADLEVALPEGSGGEVVLDVLSAVGEDQAGTTLRLIRWACERDRVDLLEVLKERGFMWLALGDDWNELERWCLEADALAVWRWLPTCEAVKPRAEIYQCCRALGCRAYRILESLRPDATNWYISDTLLVLAYATASERTLRWFLAHFESRYLVFLSGEACEDLSYLRAMRRFDYALTASQCFRLEMFEEFTRQAEIRWRDWSLVMEYAF